MDKIKVKLYVGGEMGKLVLGTFDFLDHVERVNEYSKDFDILFAASFPARIPQEDCKLAKMGAVNLHTGLLPRQRGWHPLNWAIIWGDEKVGITIHKITDSFDAGDVVVQEEVPIFETDTIRTLRQRVDTVAPKIISAFFIDPKKFLEEATQQNQALATYAPRRRPEDSELNLEAEPRQVYNLWRSCDPDQYPAFVMFNDDKKIVVSASMFLGVNDEERVRLQFDTGEVIVR